MRRRDKPDAAGHASVTVHGDAHGPISTTYIGTQVFTGPWVPVAAAVKDPQSVFMAAGIDAFAGRGWLVDKIDEFIAANRCGYVFVGNYSEIGWWDGVGGPSGSSGTRGSWCMICGC